MDTRRLRYFVVVAEELHFSNAALRLNVVQPAISQQIRLLEEELGVQLLDRSTRKVALTEAGELFLAEARQALEHIEAAKRVARDAADGTVGQIRIGFVDSALWSPLPKIIRDYSERYPGVEIELKQLARMPQMNALLEGRLDVGILPDPPAEGLIGRPFTQAPLDVVLPLGHPLCALADIPIASLVGEPLIAYASTHYVRRIDELMIAIFGAAGLTPTFGQPVEQTHTALALVSAGLGVAVVPRWMKNAWSEGVVFRPLTPATTYSLLLVTKAGRLRPTTEHFVATVQAFMTKLHL